MVNLPLMLVLPAHPVSELVLEVDHQDLDGAAQVLNSSFTLL